MKRLELLSIVFIFIISFLSLFDLFLNIGRPATFDGVIHMTFIEQYTHALLDGDFPVSWLDGFANYGLPLGLFSHQLPLTVGAILNIAVRDPVVTFNVLLLAGVFLTNVIFYKFLRLYFSLFSSLCGIVLLTCSSYRILDIYIRGDMPEIFSGIFLGLILLGLYNFVHNHKLWAVFVVALSSFALSLTHPMMLVIYSLFIFPYFFFLLLSKDTVSWQLNKTSQIFTKKNIKLIIVFLLFMGLGIGMASYFLLPLLEETKYLYYGLSNNHLVALFLSWNNFFHWDWFYFYKNDIFIRGNFINTGSVETITFIIGILFLLGKIIHNRLRTKITIVDVSIIIGVIALFLTTKFSLPLYTKFTLLTDIQFPWRMLSVFIFIPPIILAGIIDRFDKKVISLGIIFLICILRFPQLYGKNYTYYPLPSYEFTLDNLSSIEMNTIWTGKTTTYPIHKSKIGIIEGRGKILSKNIHNSWRQYSLAAYTPLRLADYTFYFPGWNVYVDGIKTPVEFQDPNYRGVITYSIPSGNHLIKVIFQDTMIRKFGKFLSLFFGLFFVIVFILRSKLKRFIY